MNAFLQTMQLYALIGVTLFLWRSRNMKFTNAKFGNTVYADAIGIYTLLNPDSDLYRSSFPSGKLPYQRIADYFGISIENSYDISHWDHYKGQFKDGSPELLKECQERIRYICNKSNKSGTSRLINLHNIIMDIPTQIKIDDKMCDLQFRIQIPGFYTIPKIPTKNEILGNNILHSVFWPYPIGHFAVLGAGWSVKKIRDFFVPA